MTREHSGETDETALKVRLFENRDIIRQYSETNVAKSFKAFADAIPVMAWISGPDGNGEFFNKKWHEYTGQTESEALGLGWQNTIHPHDLERVTNVWKMSVSTGWVYEVEVRLLRAADNVYRWHAISAVPHRDENNHIRNWISTCTDIDEKLTLLHKLSHSSELLEEKVRERTKMLDTAQSIAQMGSWEWDVEKDRISWSDAMYKVLGVPCGAPVDLQFHMSLIHPEDRDNAMTVMKQAISSNGSFQLEYRIVRPDGQMRILDSRGHTIQTKQSGSMRLSGMCMDITERKKIERELVEAKELSENIINHSVAGISSLDRNLTCTTWNVTLEHITGLKAADIIGKNILDTLPELLGADTREIVTTVLKGKSHFIAEQPFISGNGYFEAHAIPLREEAKVSGVLIIINDISERKKAEEQVKRKEAQLADAQALSHLGSWEWDLVSKTAYWSDEMYRIFGLDPQGMEVSSRTYLKYLPEKDMPRLRDILSKVTKEKIAVNFEHELLKADGSLRYIAGTIKPVPDQANRIVKLTGFSQDITEKKQKEEEIRRSRDYYLTILDEFPALIWRSGLDGKCNYLNKAWLKFTGRNKEQELDHGWLEGIHPLDLPKYQAIFTESLKLEKPFEVEHRLRRNDGNWKWVVNFGQPIYDLDGKFAGFLGACYDITDRKESAEKLMQKNEELLRSNAELEQFAYVASHDLKEPLRMVSSYTQLLAQRYGKLLDTEGHEFIEFATEGAKRMDTLISDLLEYSRIGRLNKELQEVDCKHIMDIVQHNLREAIQNTGAEIITGNLPFLRSSPTYMTQLFQNLIGNSLKFHGEKKPVIKVEAKKLRKEWIFSVRDNGIGIDAQHLNRIFIIFQRLHNRNKYPGTGIGLAVCKKIVEFHNGRIWVESETGQGATFYFSIPAA